jgi:hypothetical protein
VTLPNLYGGGGDRAPITVTGAPVRFNNSLGTRRRSRSSTGRWKDCGRQHGRGASDHGLVRRAANQLSGPPPARRGAQTGIARQWIEQVLPCAGKHHRGPVSVRVGRLTGSMGEGLAATGAKVCGRPMARLRGAVHDYTLPANGIRVTFPAEPSVHHGRRAPRGGLTAAVSVTARWHYALAGGSGMAAAPQQGSQRVILLNIIWPAFALVALIFAVWFTMFVQRYRHIRQTPPGAGDLATSASSARFFEPVETSADNLRNLFEMPVLFFALVPLLLLTQKAGLAQIVLAWLFVLCRATHSLIHINRKGVSQRARIYVVSTALLLAMWIGFFVDMVAAAHSYSEALRAMGGR